MEENLFENSWSVLEIQEKAKHCKTLKEVWTMEDKGVSNDIKRINSKLFWKEKSVKHEIKFYKIDQCKMYVP